MIAQTLPLVIFPLSEIEKKIHLSGRRYRFRSALGSADHQFLISVPKDELKIVSKIGIKN